MPSVAFTGAPLEIKDAARNVPRNIIAWPKSANSSLAFQMTLVYMQVKVRPPSFLEGGEVHLHNASGRGRKPTPKLAMPDPAIPPYRFCLHTG